jgi:predicted phosphodiesterase
MRKTIKFLVISDLQVPYHHEQAVKNVIKLARREKFDEVLCVGDEMDFQTISKWADENTFGLSARLSMRTGQLARIFFGILPSTVKKHR